MSSSFSAKRLSLESLKLLTRVRLQPMSGPNAAHARRAHARLAGHRLPTPMRGSIWLAVERQVEDALGEGLGNRGFARGAGLVLQNACQSLGGVTLTPATHFSTVHPRSLRYLLVLQALRGQEHNAGAISSACRVFPASAPLLQVIAFLVSQFNRGSHFHPTTIPPPAYAAICMTGYTRYSSGGV